MNRFELLAAGDQATDANAVPLEWGATGGRTEGVNANIDPWLGRLGDVQPECIDFVRVAVAALIADRSSRRGTDWTRDITLLVHVLSPQAWTAAGDRLTRVLSFLTGDNWTIQFVQESGVGRPEPVVVEPAAKVSLFSGGLDSFAGAVIASVSSGDVVTFVSQRDNPTTAHAQEATARWLAESIPGGFTPITISVAQAGQVVSRTSRSRSLLYFALAVAVASARHAQVAEVPENGFTSLNVPLVPNRLGPLSTRSTHPLTFQRVNELLGVLGVPIQVANPYEWQTKGELVRLAQQQAPADMAAGVGATLSCGKIDGRWYLGGNPNTGCGLCYSCIVRRGSIAAAGIQDNTPYLHNVLTGNALDQLLLNRRSDIEAVRLRLALGPVEDDLIASAPLPVGYDLDRAMDLWRRGLEELRAVELPG